MATVVRGSSETTAVDKDIRMANVLVLEKGPRLPCMLTFMFNSICSKHLDRRLQTSMFLMSSSRHVKGGCQWFNPLILH